MSKTCINILIIIGSILALNVILFFILFPPAKKLEVTGPLTVEAEDYWLDENKEDPYLKNGTLRQLQVRKWYSQQSDKKLPVIIASHGSLGTIENNVSLYRELASYGYTVIAVAHPGQAAGVKYKNGKFAGPSSVFLKQMSKMNPQKNPQRTFELFKEWMQIRLDDLNLVMDDYKSKEGDVKFIALGHSLGGSAAYAITRVRDDIVGCIALESPFMYDIKDVQNNDFIFDDSDYSVPLLNIYSDSSYKYLREWIQYKNNVKFLDSTNQNYTNIYYQGVNHMGLCDLSLFSPVFANILGGSIQKVKPRTQLKKNNEDCINWVKKI